MTTTRRELLRLGLGGSTLLACGPTVPTFLARSALALADAPNRDADGRILVVIQLDGGNDGLNTVVPHGDDIYHKSRPKLALKAKDLKPIDDHVGLHPSLDGFAKLREEGRLAIVQSVGYPNPNRSHFESMAIWQTARLNPGQEEPGWLARAIDVGRAAPGSDAPALHIAAEALPQALRGGRSFVPSVATADAVTSAPGSVRTRRGRRAAHRARPDRGPLREQRKPAVPVRVAKHRDLLRQQRPARSGPQGDGTVEDPDSYGLARRLRLIARMIKAGLSTSIYYTQLGGFDTHADQLNQHSSRLFELSRSVRSFMTEIDGSGNGDRVTVLIFSEFGRRLRENASAGTDHGTAAPVFLIGRPVQGGLHGPYPNLAHLKDEDPEHAIDFRRIYATVLERWLKLPAEASLGAQFEPLPLFRSIS